MCFGTDEEYIPASVGDGSLYRQYEQTALPEDIR